jgi:RHS repeat-associated protein
MVGVKEVTATGTQLSVSYSYDVLNNRVEDDTWKPGTGTVTVRHAYDGNNIWADVTTTNTLLARYVYGDGVDQVWARAIPAGLTNSGVAWYLTDREGSVRDIMDSSSVIQDHIDYDGYGNATHTTITVADQFGYAGGLYSYDTKMEQFGARWYDAATGRWVSQDPMGFAAGDTNLQRYCGNGPTDGTDPSGLQAKPVKEALIIIYYDFTTIKLNDAIRNGVDRRITDVLSHIQKADRLKTDYKIAFRWIDAHGEIPAKLGFTNDYAGYTSVVTLYIEDATLTGDSGALGKTDFGGFLWWTPTGKIFIKAPAISAVAKQLEVSEDEAIATTIAHEIGTHAVAGNWWHWNASSSDLDGTAASVTKGRFSLYTSVQMLQALGLYILPSAEPWMKK